MLVLHRIGERREEREGVSNSQNGQYSPPPPCIALPLFFIGEVDILFFPLVEFASINGFLKITTGS